MTVSAPVRVLEAGVVVPSRRVHSACGVAVAIVRTLEGRTAVSAVRSYVPRR